MLLTLGFFFPLNAEPLDPWPSQRGDELGQAVCTADVSIPPLEEWHFRGRSDLRYERGLAVWASPAIAIVNGKPMAFIGGCDQTMHALDLAGQQQAWFKITNGTIADAPVIGCVGDRQVVYWGSSDRTLYAHYADTGEQLWTRELIAPSSTLGETKMSAPMLLNHILYAVCFAHDKALARNNQKAWLCALDPETGEIQWRVVVDHGPVNAPIGCQIQGKNYLFVAARKGLLRAYDVTGSAPELRWTFQMPHEVMGSPAVDTSNDPPLLFLGSKFGDLMAIDALTGERRWHSMTGSWIDNNACVGCVDGRSLVFAASHDYCVYAFESSSGRLLWKRPTGGEVYSAPCFFQFGNQPMVAVASLDNRLSVINTRDGTITASYYTGEPVWDKVNKGETLWGSPVALENGVSPTLIHGSYNGYVLSLPLKGLNSLRATVRSAHELWRGLGICLLLFTVVIAPVLRFWPTKSRVACAHPATGGNPHA